MATKLDKWDIAAALIGVLAWLSPGKIPGTGGEETGAKQKMVSVLTAFLSKVDEGMWTTLLSRLSTVQKTAITLLLTYLDRFHEVASFRYTLINAPSGVSSKVVEEDIPDPADSTKTKRVKRVIKVGEYSDDDARVIFLRDIADLVNDPKWGPEAVRDMLRTQKLATENKIARHALELWKGFLSEMKKVVCAFFGMNNFDEITKAHIAAAIQKLTAKIPYRTDAEVEGKFWRSGFEKSQRTKTLVRIAISIVTAAFLIAGVVINQ